MDNPRCSLELGAHGKEVRHASSFNSMWRVAAAAVTAGVAVTSATTLRAESIPETLRNKWNDMRASMSGVGKTFREPLVERFLPAPQLDPFGVAPRTLVIDLEGTLVKCSWSREHGWRITKRPGVDIFLTRMARAGYELVIFSDNYESLAMEIVDNLDSKQVCQHRLYKECITWRDGKFVKDLSRLNRDLSRVVMIDDCPDSVSMQMENAILIPTYDDDRSDRELLKLMPLLEDIQRKDVLDVRELLQGIGHTEVADRYKEMVDKDLLERKDRQQGRRPKTQSKASWGTRK